MWATCRALILLSARRFSHYHILNRLGGGINVLALVGFFAGWEKPGGLMKYWRGHPVQAVTHVSSHSRLFKM
jgi:hypothetical protein